MSMGGTRHSEFVPRHSFVLPSFVSRHCPGFLPRAAAICLIAREAAQSDSAPLEGPSVGVVSHSKDLSEHHCEHSPEAVAVPHCQARARKSQDGLP